MMTIEVTEEQMAKMVDAFLGWPLPEDFNPDGGVTFEKTLTWMENGKSSTRKRSECPSGWWPVGTNLLSKKEALEMIKYLLDSA